MAATKFNSFDLGIEQVLGENKVPTALQFFFGEANLTFPGLRFENIAGISTLGDRVEIEISFGPTITIRNDGWCSWK